MHTCLVDRVRGVLIGGDIFCPEDDGVRITDKLRVVPAVRRVGEVVVARRIIGGHRTGVNLTVGAVTIGFGTNDILGLYECAVRTCRTRTYIRGLRKLRRVSRRAGERTGCCIERVPALCFVIAPTALKATVRNGIILVGNLTAAKGHGGNLRQRRSGYFEVERH